MDEINIYFFSSPRFFLPPFLWSGRHNVQFLRCAQFSQFSSLGEELKDERKKSESFYLNSPSRRLRPAQEYNKKKNLCPFRAAIDRFAIFAMTKTEICENERGNSQAQNDNADNENVTKTKRRENPPFACNQSTIGRQVIFFSFANCRNAAPANRFAHLCTQENRNKKREKKSIIKFKRRKRQSKVAGRSFRLTFFLVVN